MNVKRYFRVFEVKEDLPHTIFHGVRRSKKLSLDEWIESETKNVRDGSKGKVYKSGFHVIEDVCETIDFFVSRFKIFKNRVIAAVDIDIDAGIWPKKHSKGNVFLAKMMLIQEKEWNKRIYLSNFFSRKK